MKVQVIDYGMGNLGSVVSAVGLLGCDAEIVSLHNNIQFADKIILPGVGNFKNAMHELQKNNWIEEIKEHVMNKKKPILGICLGMQLLATMGDEGGITEGLGFIPGEVKHLRNLGCKERIPHVGWNDTHIKDDSFLFGGVNSGNDFFYVHSYAFQAFNANHVSSIVNYGEKIVASVEHENVFGTQFHPEKSSKAGLKLLKNFLEF